jgi:magnesium-protoporphyrin O-methyltransferase
MIPRMPQSCCRPDYDALFDEKMANGDLDDYRKHGAQGETRDLIEAVKQRGVDGATLLDIGGGVGVIGQELLAAGAAHLTDVDASHAFLEAARWLAGARGTAERAEYHFGDFVELAPAVPPADVVTLDRVICCYPDWPALIDASVSHARRLYGLVYPVDRWWLRAGAWLGNLFLRITRQSFRFYIHPSRSVDARVRGAGFARVLRRRGLLWQVVLYERLSSA